MEEQLLEERVRLGDERRRFKTREVLGSVVVEPSGEHAVCQGLRIDVRKLFRFGVG